MIPLMMSKWDEHYFHLERDLRVMASNDVFFVLVQVIKKLLLEVIFFLNGSQQTSRCLGVMLNLSFLLAGLSCQVCICGDFHC